MDFPDMLAASIHDIKNSLSLISSNLTAMLAHPDNRFAEPQQISLIQHEVQRVNNTLIQLLNLYKLGKDALRFEILEHNVEEFFAEVVANSTPVCRALGIHLTYCCDPDLNGYFDSEMVRSILENTIGNAQRYARSQILLRADRQADYLVLYVEDDGDGFPPELLQLSQDVEGSISASRISGRTRLGLLFAQKIARLHQAGQRSGYIRLHNACTLPGGCFQLWLP